MQAEIKEVKVETEQERQKRLDDTFKELKLESKRQYEIQQNEIDTITSKLVNYILEEYMSFLKNNLLEAFESTRCFETSNNKIVLKPGLCIDANSLEFTLARKFLNRDYNVRVREYMERGYFSFNFSKLQ